MRSNELHAKKDRRGSLLKGLSSDASEASRLNYKFLVPVVTHLVSSIDSRLHDGGAAYGYVFGTGLNSRMVSQYVNVLS